MKIRTADLCDQFADELKVAAPIFKNFGGRLAFHGQLATVQVFEDNVLVKQILETPGAGKVLVVDGGGSVRCALVGGVIAALAQKNSWAGILINGAIRDVEELAQLAIGIKALNTNPWRSNKIGAGVRALPVTFAGITFTPDHYLYADEDGVVVAPRALV